MGATSSKQPSPLQKEPPSTSLKIKPTETQLVSGYEYNNMPTQPRKILETDSKQLRLQRHFVLHKRQEQHTHRRTNNQIVP